jgi:hypothetical protein
MLISWWIKQLILSKLFVNVINVIRKVDIRLTPGEWTYGGSLSACMDHMSLLISLDKDIGRSARAQNIPAGITGIPSQI